MRTGELRDDLQTLISEHTPSMDHIAVLLALRATPEAELAGGDLARETRLDRAVVDKVLEDLVRSALVERTGDRFRFASAPPMTSAIEELANMYHTRPVTLVRAIYDRPKRAVQSFADAFRLRGDEP